MPGATIWTDSIIDVHQVTCYNLTQIFGAGNEPSKEWCDANLPDYFEGVKSVQIPMRVKSRISNNILDIKDWARFLAKSKPETPFIKNIKENGFRVDMATAFFDVNYPLNAAPNTQYYMGLTLDNITIPSNEDRAYISISINYVGIPYITTIRHNIKDGVKDVKLKAIIPQDRTISHISIYRGYVDSGGFDIKNFYISEVDEYDTYETSNLYINNQLELKSVGTTRDYIEDGKLYKSITKRQDDFKVEYSFWLDKTTVGDEECITCRIKRPKDAYYGRSEEDLYNFYKGIVHNQKSPAVTYIPWSYYLHISESYINFQLPLGTTKEEFEKKIEDFYYVLNETEVSNLNTSGLIVNQPNGTIFIEPVTNLTAFYNDGLDVSKLTIKEVESFSVFKDGNYQDLDVSKVSIRDGKLTHPEAVNGLVYLVYRYDDSPIYGVNSVDYYNSDKTLKSPNGKIWKKVERATDDGELEIVLEEVNINKEGKL